MNIYDDVMASLTPRMTDRAKHRQEIEPYEIFERCRMVSMSKSLSIIHRIEHLFNLIQFHSVFSIIYSSIPSTLYNSMGNAKHNYNEHSVRE